MYQDVMGQTCVKLARKNEAIVGLTAAMPSGTGMKHLEKAMPERYYDVGIAEEHGVVLMDGGGFGGPKWSFRISLANLADETYEKIGDFLVDCAQEYLSAWEKSKPQSPQPKKG